MASLASELLQHTDEIVQRWYETWSRTKPSRPEISEAALKDMLPDQLRVIGQQLQALSDAEDPEQVWTQHRDRLDPEVRVEQEVPIEEVVQEYAVAVDTVRNWISEQRVEVPFREYSYFHAAMFELAAEAVRRYSTHEAEVVRTERARYLASVMHQLRNPVSTLSLVVQQLERQQSSEPMVSRLRRSVDRIQTLVDGILRLERFNPSEVPLRPERVHVETLVDEILDEQSPTAKRKHLRTESKVDSSLDVSLDRALLHDALGNLVDNAVKFTKEGSVGVEVEASDDEVLFHVRDSGPGIEPERQARLFKETQPGSHGGAGIGLQIAMHAAQAMGGTIELASEVGKGSVFTLRLPRTVQARGDQQPT